MAVEMAMNESETTEAAGAVSTVDAHAVRVYEAGYHISPSVKEEDIEKIVAGIRAVIEKSGGSFIAEGAPVLMRLAFPIDGLEDEKKYEYDRSYFGWLKFESSSLGADDLRNTLAKHPSIFRSIVFRTVREETRARLKAPQLREVKRGNTLRTTPRRVEAAAAPVSEEQLDKAIETLTLEP